MAKRPGGLSVVHGFGPEEDVDELAIAKLASSGITPLEANLLGITWHPVGEVLQMGKFWPLPALRLNYFDPLTKEPMRAKPNWPEFYRLRALREPVQTDEDFKKYLQAPDTGVCAYFPRTLDWAPIFKDPSVSLIITEGELKAAKATIEGFPTFGLGGVNSYRSSDLGFELLPSMEAIDWSRRIVIIAYDSDFRANKNVCRALNALADTLTGRGAKPRMLLLPSADDGSKMGLDDYLVANHPDLFRQMIEQDTVQHGLGGPLWDYYNQNYAYVRSMHRIVDRRRTYFYTVAAFREADNKEFKEHHLRDDGSITTTPMLAAAKWLMWPLRQEVQKVVYKPGEESLALIPSDSVGADEYDADFNTWPGWGVEAARSELHIVGSQPAHKGAEPFVKLVSHLLSTTEPEAARWFFQWCAYPLRHPGTKLYSSVIFHGLEQGTGKSLVGYTLGKIYGKNFSEIQQTDLQTGFNEWAINKQFVMGDDVSGSDKRHDLDLLKKMITQKTIRINAKHQPTYDIDDTINYFWTSNHHNAFPLEDKDRRFAVYNIFVEPLPDSFYREYNDWLENGGAAYVFEYLLNYDLTGFNPRARAITTNAKSQMTQDSQTSLAVFVRDLLANPDDLLRIGDMPMPGDLFTNKQVLRAYLAYAADDQGLDKITAKAVGAELARAGARRVHGSMPVRLPGQPLDRYYALRNPAKWEHASLAEIRAHLLPPEVAVKATKKDVAATHAANRAKRGSKF